jgi:hypothetical protein
MTMGGPVKMEKVSYAGWPNCLKLSNGEMEIIVTTDVGPRVIRCGFVGGQNLFKEFKEEVGKTGGDEWRSYGGHRLWHAPEAMPRTYALDNSPVPYEWDGKTLTITQPTEPETGVSKKFEITLHSDRNQVTLNHYLINHNLWDIELSPWCLTVMAQNGRAIFPQEDFRPHPDYLLPARPMVMWHYTDLSDPRWIIGTKYFQLQQDPKNSRKQKVGILNTKGWEAYALGGDLFIKRHGFDPNAVYPDYNCNAETFTNEEFLEIESLGPLTKLTADGGMVEHVENWFLFKAEVGKDEASIDKNVLPLVEKTSDFLK